MATPDALAGPVVKAGEAGNGGEEKPDGRGGRPHKGGGLAVAC